MLDTIKYEPRNQNFKIPIPILLQKKLVSVFDESKKYIGIAPGAGEINKIWPLENFIQVGKYYQKKKYEIVLYLGPDELHLNDKLMKYFPNAINPEKIIKGYSNIEIILASTKFLSCAIANDSGISHMLSTKYCYLIKLFGPKNSNKFSPNNEYIKTISSENYNSKDVKIIPIKKSNRRNK